MSPLESFVVDHSSGLPVWIQLRNRIAYLIASGAYCEGDRLPSVRALAADLDIAYNTVNRAYMDLEREGYVTSRPGRGTFVAGSGKAIEQGDYSAIDSLVEGVIGAARNVGMSDEDILSLIQEKIKSL